MLSLLRQRDFGLLWVGGLVSHLGSWAMFTALPVFVYERTGSALASALTFTATVAPMLLSSVAGVFVDRWNRKNTLVMANIAMGVLTCSFLLAGPTRTWLVYVSMFCVSLAGLVVSPAENALLPTLVRRDQLVAANALNALNDNLGRIAGPAVGGLLLAFGGFTDVVILDATTYVVAALLIRFIRTGSGTGSQGRTDLSARPNSPERRRASPLLCGPDSWRTQWQAGLRYVRASAVVTVVLAIAATALLGDAIFSSLLAPFVAEALSSGAAVLGLFLTIRGIGGVLGGMLAILASRWISPAKMIGWSTLTLAALLMAIVTVPTVPVALVCAAFLGVFVVCWLANQQTLLQTNVANHYLGRTHGILETATAVTLILGSILAGTLANRLGVSTLLCLASGLYATAGITALFYLRKSRTAPTTSSPETRHR